MNKQSGQHNSVKKGGSKTPASNNKGTAKESASSAGVSPKEPANAKSPQDSRLNK